MLESDRPIQDPKGDLLNRHNFSLQLAKSLMSLRPGDTFTVGLFGTWGSGKTSLVNMTLHEMECAQRDLSEEERTTVIQFEPWNFTDSNQLISQFFVRLINCLRSKKDKRLIQIGNAFEKYADAFSVASIVPGYGKLIETAGKNSIKSFAKWIKKDMDAQDAMKQKCYVEELLHQQTSRILIVIDDIDRLNNEQIRCVFQLVTAVAKLPNIIYLLVFDKDIVAKALGQVQGGNGNDYLEKVIQIPISIPELRKQDLYNVLFKKLDQLLIAYPGISFEEEHWNRIFQYCVKPFISSIREVNRLCNVLEFKLSSISEEVDFADLCAITLIENKFSKLYDWIKSHKPVLTGENDWQDSWLQKKKPEEWNKKYMGELTSLLDEGEEPQGYIKVLSVLFPHFGQKIGQGMGGYDLNAARTQNRLSHPSKFDRYFNLNLDFIGLKKSMITNVAYFADEKQVTAAVLNADEKEYGYELLDELRSLKDTLTNERAIVLVKALFSTATSLSTSSGGLFSSSARGYVDYVLLDIMQKVDVEKRFDLLTDILSCSDGSVFAEFASILNIIELAYGRLAAKGEERGDDKTITLEELERLEPIFCARAREVLKENCLFDLCEWKMITYLLECFCSEYIVEYMQNNLTLDENIIKYLPGCITKWYGSRSIYQLDGDYEKYISKERGLDAINAAKETGILFSLSQENQERIAAYYVAVSSVCVEEIAAESVLEMLKKWKEEYTAGKLS